MIGYYVYYKIDRARQRETVAAVRAAMRALAAATGVQGRLLARADEPDTWMEIYEPVGDRAAFDAALDRALRDAGVHALLPHARVVERFVALGD